jgi:hypothetical protein
VSWFWADAGLQELAKAFCIHKKKKGKKRGKTGSSWKGGRPTGVLAEVEAVFTTSAAFRDFSQICKSFEKRLRSPQVVCKEGLVRGEQEFSHKCNWHTAQRTKQVKAQATCLSHRIFLRPHAINGNGRVGRTRRSPNAVKSVERAMPRTGTQGHTYDLNMRPSKRFEGIERMSGNLCATAKKFQELLLNGWSHIKGAAAKGEYCLPSRCAAPRRAPL